MGINQLTDDQIAEYTRVAYYYYKEGNTQEQIAKRMNMSRQRVNRILAACLEYGIVQITINTNTKEKLLELESQLKEKYNLLDVRVVDNVNRSDIYFDLGKLAGQYLATILKDGDIVGFSRGTTLAAMAAQMPVVHKKNITVVQMLGSRNQEPQYTAADEIVHNISNRLGAKAVMLFAPILVSNKELKSSLQEEPAFRETYKIIQACNIAVVGVGALNTIVPHYVRMGVDIYESAKPREGQILTGEVSTHIFDQNGESVVNMSRERIIAVELDDYMKIPGRIGVAGLPEKAKAIRAAMLGKYINVLVVDTSTARLLLEM